jgi:hypothetical protein
MAGGTSCKWMAKDSCHPERSVLGTPRTELSMGRRSQGPPFGFRPPALKASQFLDCLFDHTASTFRWWTSQPPSLLPFNYPPLRPLIACG